MTANSTQRYDLYNPYFSSVEAVWQLHMIGDIAYNLQLFY